MKQNSIIAPATTTTTTTATTIIPHDAAIQACGFPKNHKDKGSQRSCGGAKKKRGPMQLLRVALFMLRRKPPFADKPQRSLHVEAAETKNVWTKLVGSIRPLHLQESNSPRALSPAPEAVTPPAPSEHFVDVFAPPMSPSVSESGMSSKYASAQNLQSLDGESEADDEDEEEDGGDEMIDLKAEAFIAQFHEQMRLQLSDSIFHHSHRMMAPEN